MDRDQRIRDPVHNLISFSEKREEDKLLWALLQSFPMQRLRRIRQLGFSDQVYPGATHTRFSHVIGAMHMARRMLDVFQRNQIFENNDAHKKQRMATLAAALVHDVGHGPYSHVFEEVSESLKIKKRHEAYTEEIIKNTEIKETLEKFGVFGEVLNFFSQEPGADAYSAIISSQMDCDRLDFLVRDKHHSGIRSNAIDLEWLFDSLRIESVPFDPLTGVRIFTFVVLPKGVSVVEEFVLSYIKMYQNVYFHKTTRAAQHMIRDILSGLLKSDLATNEPFKSLPIVRYFVEGAKSLDAYLYLDDTSVMTVVQLLASGDFGDLSKLAKRYFVRDLYKCVELPRNSAGKIQTALAAKFIDALRNEKVTYFDDVVTDRSYKQYEVMDDKFLKNIFVKQNGDFEPLGDVSQIVRTTPNKSVRIYFPNAEERDKALAILAKCRENHL